MLRHTPASSTQKSGRRRTIRTTRASRASRSRVDDSRTPGTNDRDHDEVEHVPPVAEELQRAPPVRAEPDRELHDEDRQADVVDEVELLAELFLEARVGLESQRDGVGDDHDHDHGREPGALRRSGRDVRTPARLLPDRVRLGDVRRQVRRRRAPRRVNTSTASSASGAVFSTMCTFASVERAAPAPAPRRPRCAGAPPHGAPRRSRRRGGSATAPDRAGCSRRTPLRGWSRSPARAAPGTTEPPSHGRLDWSRRHDGTPRSIGACRSVAAPTVTRTHSRPSGPARVPVAAG